MKSVFFIQFISLIIFSNLCSSQIIISNDIKNKELTYENISSWHDVLSKSKLDNKFILVDCYASWCLPCKKMDSIVFSNDSVKEFLNSYFIKIKYQIDTTKCDSHEIQHWQKIINNIVTKYRVEAFPTFLIFDTSGVLVKKMEGAILSPSEFLLTMDMSINPLYDYFKLKNNFNKGILDHVYLRPLLQKALEREDQTLIDDIGSKIIKTSNNPLTKERIDSANFLMRSSLSEAFKLFKLNYDTINSIIGQKRFAQNSLLRIIKYEVYRDFLKQAGDSINWRLIKVKIDSICPFLTREAISELKIIVASTSNNFEAYCRAQLDHYDNFPESLNLDFINNSLWIIFERCNNRNLLLRAAAWSKKTVYAQNKKQIDISVYDTYANILYKIGKLKAAIIWEKIAIKEARDAKDLNNLTVFNETLRKMISGIPTWKASF